MRTPRLLNARVGSTSVMPPLSRRGRTGAVIFLALVGLKLSILTYLALTASGGLALGARLALVMAVGGAAACGIVASI
ncbi:MAG: hypothetical protein ACRDV9_11595, partial [Acidimicrobiia bacterium]